MSHNIFLPFSQATCEVFKLLMDLTVFADDPQNLLALTDNDDKVNIIIGVTGDLAGHILYRFPKDTTLEMVKIMSGMDIEEIDDFVTSALGEIANIISGNALTGLSQQQLICDIQPPQVMMGVDVEDLTNHEGPILGTQVTTPIGNIELNIQIHESVK